MILYVTLNKYIISNFIGSLVLSPFRIKEIKVDLRSKIALDVFYIPKNLFERLNRKSSKSGWIICSNHPVQEIF